MSQSKEKTLQDFLPTLREMRSLGWAVAVWSPEELGDADPKRLEDVVIERGNLAIPDLKS